MMQESNLTEVEVLEHFFPPVLPKDNTFPYQLSAGGHFRCGSSYFTARDCYQFSLLLYTYRGCGEIIYRNNKTELPCGTMILLDEKYAHRYGSAPEKNWEFIWMHYKDLSPVSFADYLFEKNILLQQVPPKEAEEFFTLLKKMASETTLPVTIQISGLISSFFTKWGMYNYSRQYPVPESRESLIQKAGKYIREHFSSDISLEDMADWCCVSKYYLIKIFRETMNMTPHQYLLRIRINHAKLLLLNTSESVSAIGEAAGFQNTSSFIAVFKKLEGTTPLRYRNVGAEEIRQ